MESVGKRCYIAGAGDFTGLYMPGPGDYVIAADGGYARLVSLGIIPDLVVGDFDSLGSVPDHPNTILSPVEKDDTDMMLAVKQGLARGYSSFIIDGGLDGRLDHTLANIQVLAYMSANAARGVLLGRDMSVTAVTNGSVVFRPNAAGRISVFGFDGRAEGVTLTGLKYALENAALTSDYPLGISNEFTGKISGVSVRTGTLIVMWTGGPDCLEDCRV